MRVSRTSKPEYGQYILKALRIKENASIDEVMEETFRLMEPSLYPIDLEVLPGEVPRWRSQAENMLVGLIEDGYVAESQGVFTLTRRGLEYLSGS